MIPAYFKITIETMKFKSQDIVQASYLVICCDWPVSVAGERYAIDQTTVSRTAKSIREKWYQIYTEKKLLCEPVVLTPVQMESIRKIEDANIGELLRQSRKWESFNLENI